MTKSRIAVVGILVTPAIAVATPPDRKAPALTAEIAIRRQREQLVTASGIDCRGGSEEIVVCGRRAAEPEFSPVPGDRRGLIAGEAPTGRAAMRAGERNCFESRACGGIDVFKVVSVLVKTGKHLIDPDD